MNSLCFAALTAACLNGRLDVVTHLLQLKSDVGAQNSRGTYPIHCAASSGNCEIVELLLHEGAALEQGDKSDRTPLMMAAADGHGSAVELLLSKGTILFPGLSCSFVDIESRLLPCWTILFE